jgi:hypothetical protein
MPIMATTIINSIRENPADGVLAWKLDISDPLE